MFSDSPADKARDVLARLAGVVDELQALPLGSLTGDEVLDVLRELERQKRRLGAVDHAVVAEVEQRGLAAERAWRDTAVLLRQVLLIDPREAAARVASAADLGPRPGLTGEALPPIFAATAVACAQGVVSAAQARIITRTISRLPAAVQAEHDTAVEAFLVEHASSLDPALLARAAARLAATLDQDGILVGERDRERHRALTIRQRPDGSAEVEGELTAVCAEALLTVLDTLARPQPTDDGQRDPRTATQRRHDALQDGLLMLLRSEQLPACNGVAATILLTATVDQLSDQDALLTTGHGAGISTRQAMTLIGDAQVVPVVLTRTKAVAAYGSAHRIFTQGQRLALIARDQGCSFPGCDAPPAQCEAHHVTDFALTHRTSVDDGTLLCGYHHREHARLGWTCRMVGGIPHWVPPAWLDPTQTPRRNHLHQPALV